MLEVRYLPRSLPVITMCVPCKLMNLDSCANGGVSQDWPSQPCVITLCACPNGAKGSFCFSVPTALPVTSHHHNRCIRVVQQPQSHIRKTGPTIAKCPGFLPNCPISLEISSSATRHITPPQLLHPSSAKSVPSHHHNCCIHHLQCRWTSGRGAQRSRRLRQQ